MNSDACLRIVAYHFVYENTKLAGKAKEYGGTLICTNKHEQTNFTAAIAANNS